jgi:hypothetical protein
MLKQMVVENQRKLLQKTERLVGPYVEIELKYLTKYNKKILADTQQKRKDDQKLKSQLGSPVAIKTTWNSNLSIETTSAGCMKMLSFLSAALFHFNQF